MIDIHEFQRIIKLLDEIIYRVRIQNYSGARRVIRDVYRVLDEAPVIMSDLIGVYGKDNVSAVLNEINSALEKDDMVLCADQIEAGVIPALAECCRGEENIVEGRYSIEPTMSGFLTVKSMEQGIYLHSNNDPILEARILMEKYHDPTFREYAVWGAGLGYHIAELYRLSQGAVTIRVYDDDPVLLDIAKKYGVYRDIPDDRFSLIEDRNGSQFVDDISNGTGIFIHLPSLQKIQNEGLKDVLWKFFMKWNGFSQIKNNLAVNFRENLINCDENICALKDRIKDRDIVIIAGGPSLDDNIDFVKECGEKGRIIMTVTTVLKRLLNIGIVPDYTVVMEADEEVYAQIRGVEHEDRPAMIVGSTSYWKIASAYSGRKYIAFQEGYDPAEAKAKEMGVDVFATGHSVTTLALSIALKFGVSGIYLVGADMAYKDGVSHASGTAQYHTTDNDRLIPVQGVNGDTVYTTMALNTFREWIETEIEKYPNIPVYNLSKTGALIQGTHSPDGNRG